MFCVAKWSATYGEYVQSSSRVGRPWCWPSASQSQSVSCGTASWAAYLRNARMSWRSSSCPPPSRASALCKPAPASEAPRYARLERKRPRSSFHASAKRSSCSSSQPEARCSCISLLSQEHEVLGGVASCSLGLELEKRKAARERLAEVPLGVVRAAEVRAGEVAPADDQLAPLEARALVAVEARQVRAPVR